MQNNMIPFKADVLLCWTWILHQVVWNFKSVKFSEDSWACLHLGHILCCFSIWDGNVVGFGGIHLRYQSIFLVLLLYIMMNKSIWNFIFCLNKFALYVALVLSIDGWDLPDYRILGSAQNLGFPYLLNLGDIFMVAHESLISVEI